VRFGASQWRKKGEGRGAAAHPVWGVGGSLRGWVGWSVVGVIAGRGM